MVLKTEAVAQRCFVEVVLEISENSQENPVLESLKEESLAQVFFCEFGEICKNTFFIENLGCLCQYASELLK